MSKKKRIGKILMITGAALLIAALCLFIYNTAVSEKAKLNSTEITNKIIEEMNTDDSVPAPYNPNMSEKKIGKYYYIGYLTIPSLKLDLPVMSTWSERQLKLAPCRYSGSTKTNNLVIAAHNYTSYFARIKNLDAKDKVYFTDMDGVKTAYNVADTETLSPTSVDKMINSKYDLTLFTCTYSGNARVAVRCVKEN